MHDSQNKSNEPFKDMRECISATVGLAQALSLPVRIWLTRFGTAGELFFGNRLAVVGWVIMFAWPMFFAPHNPRPMLAFWGVTTLMMLPHRVRHWRLRRRGYRVHSQYVGESRLSPLGGHKAARWLWEPLFTALGGGACLDWNRPLGMYLVWSAMGMVISTAYLYAVEESALRRLRDAKCEQEWLAEKMQEEEDLY